MSVGNMPSRAIPGSGYSVTVPMLTELSDKRARQMFEELQRATPRSGGGDGPFAYSKDGSQITFHYDDDKITDSHISALTEATGHDEYMIEYALFDPRRAIEEMKRLSP